MIVPDTFNVNMLAIWSGDRHFLLLDLLNILDTGD
jgi:hypothetical protein